MIPLSDRLYGRSVRVDCPEKLAEISTGPGVCAADRPRWRSGSSWTRGTMRGMIGVTVSALSERPGEKRIRAGGKQ